MGAKGGVRLWFYALQSLMSPLAIDSCSEGLARCNGAARSADACRERGKEQVPHARAENAYDGRLLDTIKHGSWAIKSYKGLSIQASKKYARTCNLNAREGTERANRFR